jgi:tetratricopeptide (TPR) repeat protein
MDVVLAWIFEADFEDKCPHKCGHGTLKACATLVAVWLTLCLSLFAQPPLEEALELARHSRFAEARAVLKGVPEPDGVSQRIAYHRLLAAIASGLHEPAAAVSEMKAALTLAPADPRLLLALAVTELQAGQTDDALSRARTSPESATREALIGDIQEKRGQYAEAAKAYEAAVALAPDREQYRVALGLELIEHQSFEKAVALLKHSATMFPKSAKILTLLGIAQYGQGYTDEAVISLEDAIALAPKTQAPYAALSKIVLQSSAAPAPRTLDCLCPWNELVCSALQLRIARATGDVNLERKATGDLKLAPATSVVGRCELARAYEWANQLEQARAELETCVRLDPSPQNHYRLGLLYKRLGLNSLAQDQMQQRNQVLRHMSEQTALGLSALQDLDAPAR